MFDGLAVVDSLAAGATVDLGNIGILDCWANVVGSVIDLRADGATAPTEAILGGQISVTSNFANTMATSGPFEVGFYFSTDSVIDAGDHYAGLSCLVPPLGPGDVAVCNGMANVPNLVPGPYFVGVLVDRLNAVGETNEFNNGFSAPIEVTGLFGDTFNAPLDPGVWTIVDEGTSFAPSNWFVDSGVLRQTSNIFGGSLGAADLPKPGTYLLGGDLLWDDYTFSARMQTTDDDAMGVMFRYQDVDNYYRFSMDSQRGYRRLVKKVGGVFTVLFEDADPFVPGQPYDVKVVTSGADIQISIDGLQVINVNDAAIGAGKIALYSWGNDGLSFDNVSVTTGGGIMTPPVVMISMPADGSSFASGATITFEGSAIDAEDGPITGSLSWSSVPPGLTGTGSPVMDVLADGVYTITASVTDSHGLVDSDEVTVIVQNARNLLFSDDFSSALTWTIFDEGTNSAPSNWFVDSGVLRQASNIYGGSTGAAGLPKPGTYVRPFAVDPGWTDYTFSARMKSTDNDGMGMMFRYQDDDNYYRLSMDSERGYRRLVKKVGGVFTLLFEDTFSFVLGQWIQVEVLALGDKIVIYIDGQLWNIAMDSSLPNGQIGLYSWGNEGLSFDDVFVFEDAYRIQPPVVTISEPFDGEVFATLADITFAGSATDPQEGDLTGNLSWTSVPSELTGTGSPVMQMLADGVYTITASVTDLDGLVGNQEIEITVGTPTPPLLNDTFDAPLDMGVWTIVDEGTNFAPSNWFVDLGFGVLRQTSNIFGGSTGAAGLPKPGTYLLGGDLLWDDYTFSASMETTDDDAMGMMFRYQGSDDYYRFSMDSQRGYLRLVKKVGGVFTSLFEDAFSFVLGQSYDVEVITSGADIQISIDGTAVINVTDAAFATGQIALYSWGNDGLSFDDVSVTTGGGGIMTPPVVMISMPADGSSFASGATITFAGSAIDAEDGDITGILSWTSVPSGLTGTGSPVMDVLADGVYTITASVTDSHGFVDSDEVTVIVQNATGTLLLSNDFSSALTWTIFDEGTNAAPSNWFVDSGVLRQTSNIYGGSIGAAGLPKPGTYVRPFPGNPGWTDYTFSARMKSTDDDGMGMMFRYQDDDNYYRFSMDSQRGYRRLVKKVAGVFTLLFEDTFSFVLGQWSQVEVVAGGDKIVIYIDGQLWNIAMDSDLPDGQIGLYSWGNEGLSFDDVFVFEDAYRIQPPVVTISEPFDGEVFATLQISPSQVRRPILRRGT